MKILSNILFAISLILICLWGIFYAYVMSLACGYSSVNNNNCTVKMPWMLNREDLLFLVGTPAALIAIIILIAIYLRNADKKKRAAKPSE